MIIYYLIKWLIESFIEFWYLIAWGIARSVVWFFTARDCKRCQYKKYNHCSEGLIWMEYGPMTRKAYKEKYGYEVRGEFVYNCAKGRDNAHECIESIHRKHFKRKKGA